MYTVNFQHVHHANFFARFLQHYFNFTCNHSLSLNHAKAPPVDLPSKGCIISGVRTIYLDVHVYAVFGLPYPNHTQSNYTKMKGACPEEFYNRTEEVSPSTCRYLCDTAPQNQTCSFGYTYYDITLEDARLGTTVSTCRFLNGNCKPTRRKHTAYTYFREQMTIRPSKR